MWLQVQLLQLLLLVPIPVVDLSPKVGDQKKWDTLSTRTVKIDQCTHQSAPSDTSLGWEQTSWRTEKEK